jgi:hypothetical protein
MYEVDGVRARGGGDARGSHRRRVCGRRVERAVVIGEVESAVDLSA